MGTSILINCRLQLPVKWWNAAAVGGSFSALFVIILIAPSHPLSGHLFNLAAFWCRALQFSLPLSCISYSGYCSSLIVFFSMPSSRESMFVNYGIALRPRPHRREHCVIIPLMNMLGSYLYGHRNLCVLVLNAICLKWNTDHPQEDIQWIYIFQWCKLEIQTGSHWELDS